MWNNYFFQIQTKYNMRISQKEPLVIRLDGKNVTKNEKINLIEKCEGSFFSVLTKSAEYFTKKYDCYSIYGSDEISFIFTNPMKIVEELDFNSKSTYTNEISSMFAQYFFDYFNKLYKDEKIFWHTKCFSINESKIKSYIKYRSGIIKNVLVTYFLNKEKIYVGEIKLKEKSEKCKLLPNYEKFKEIEYGNLFCNGKEIDLNDCRNDPNIKEIEKNIDTNVEIEQIY